MHIREIRVAAAATLAGLVLAAGVGQAATPTTPAITPQAAAVVSAPVQQDVDLPAQAPFGHRDDLPVDR